MKTLQLADDFNSVGLLITVFKNNAASSIVVECIGTSPPTILGQVGPLELQPTIAESRSFSLAASGNDFRFVGLPRIAEAVETAFLADDAVTTDKLDDGAVTDEKIAADALDGWEFGASPEVPAPTADEHAVNRGYIPSGTTAASTSSPTNVTSVTATWFWIRVGDFVTATLRATLTNSNVATPKSFVATMPFAPVDGTWGSALRVGGGVANNGSTVEVAGVPGQARVLVRTQEDTNGAATRTWAATFVYQAAPVSP